MCPLTKSDKRQNPGLSDFKDQGGRCAPAVSKQCYQDRACSPGSLGGPGQRISISLPRSDGHFHAPFFPLFWNTPPPPPPA